MVVLQMVNNSQCIERLSTQDTQLGHDKGEGSTPKQPSSMASFLSIILCCLSLLSDLWNDIILMGFQYCSQDLGVSRLSLHWPAWKGITSHLGYHFPGLHSERLR